MTSIDLHGVRYRDVDAILEKACSEFDLPFVVVTGNSADMKRQVSRVCASFNLSVRDTIDNPGRVLVYEASQRLHT